MEEFASIELRQDFEMQAVKAALSRENRCGTGQSRDGTNRPMGLWKVDLGVKMGVGGGKEELQEHSQEVLSSQSKTKCDILALHTGLRDEHGLIGGQEGAAGGWEVCVESALGCAQGVPVPGSPQLRNSGGQNWRNSPPLRSSVWNRRTKNSSSA